MLNVVKEKLELSPDLRKKINLASKYTSTSITLEKGALIKLEPTNIAYVDPHKVIINDIKFLFFNGVDCFYINSLNDKHEFSELETMLKRIDYLANNIIILFTRGTTMNKILKLSKDEYESLIKREKIIGEASSESIIYDLNNGYILKDLMDESLFYFKSKEEMMYTEEQLLRFSDIDVDSFYFTKKIIYVDEVLRACIMKKCNGYVVNYIDPLSINLNSIIKAIDKFTKDTNIISKMHILGYDMQSNFMYDGNKFGAIDTIHYNFSDMDEDKIFSKNIFSFNDEIAKFLVEIYFKKFINEDITLNNMYESIKQNEMKDLNSFIKLFIKKLSEYCNKQIVYLKDATNAIRENDNLLYPYCPIYSLKR